MTKKDLSEFGSNLTHRVAERDRLRNPPKSFLVDVPILREIDWGSFPDGVHSEPYQYITFRVWRSRCRVYENQMTAPDGEKSPLPRIGDEAIMYNRPARVVWVGQFAWAATIILDDRPGYYWVKMKMEAGVGREWTVGCREGNPPTWSICGSDAVFAESDVDDIGPRIESPYER